MHLHSVCDYAYRRRRTGLPKPPCRSSSTAPRRRRPRSGATVKMFGDGKLPPDVDAGSPFDAFEQATRRHHRGGPEESSAACASPGIDGRILWRRRHQTFIATTGNVLLTFTRKRASGTHRRPDRAGRRARGAGADHRPRARRASSRRGRRARRRLDGPDGIVQAEDWPDLPRPLRAPRRRSGGRPVPGRRAGGGHLRLDPRRSRLLPDHGLVRRALGAEQLPARGRRNRHIGRRCSSSTSRPGDQPKRVLDSYLSSLRLQRSPPQPGRGAHHPRGAPSRRDVRRRRVLPARQHRRAARTSSRSVDRYVLELEARAGEAKKRRGGRSDLSPSSSRVDSYTLKTAMEAVVANARSQLGTTE